MKPFCEEFKHSLTHPDLGGYRRCIVCGMNFQPHSTIASLQARYEELILNLREFTLAIAYLEPVQSLDEIRQRGNMFVKIEQITHKLVEVQREILALTYREEVSSPRL